ncbi:cysteine-rich VLP domain-containing protein [Caproiciproducens sp.]
METVSRELTRDERAGIRRLATGMCANYDPEYGCLPLECPCYMLGKCWTGAYCRYFQNTVLPLDSALEAKLTDSVGTAPKRFAPSVGRRISRSQIRRIVRMLAV